MPAVAPDSRDHACRLDSEQFPAPVCTDIVERSKVPALEMFFIGLLALMSLIIGWFSVYVVYKLFQGQR